MSSAGDISGFGISNPAQQFLSQFSRTTYTGDGAASKLINVGFRAKFAWIINTAGSTAGGIITFTADGSKGVSTPSIPEASTGGYTTATSIDVGKINTDFFVANTNLATYVIYAFG